MKIKNNAIKIPHWNNNPLRVVSKRGHRKRHTRHKSGIARTGCVIGIGLFVAGLVFLPGWWKLLGAVMAFQFAAPAIGEWVKSRNGTDGL